MVKEHSGLISRPVSSFLCSRTCDSLKLAPRLTFRRPPNLAVFQRLNASRSSPSTSSCILIIRPQDQRFQCRLLFAHKVLQAHLSLHISPHDLLLVYTVSGIAPVELLRHTIQYQYFAACNGDLKNRVHSCNDIALVKVGRR